MKRFLTLFIALVMLFSCACAEGAAPTFTAIGSAPFAAEADSAVMTFTIRVSDETLPEAESRASSAVDALKYALLSAGAQAADISSVRSDVQNDQQYQYNKIKEPELIIIGCSVEYVMTVNVPDIARLKAIVDAAVVSGRYADYEVKLLSSGRQEACEAALAEAAKMAVSKAEALAKACGYARTEVLAVTEMPSASDGLNGIVSVEATVTAQK